MISPESAMAPGCYGSGMLTENTGEYVSFPVFEAFGDYKSEDEDDEVAPPPRR